MAIETIVLLACGALLTLLGCILLTGRGVNLVAGYNTMPKEKKTRYDAQAISKFAGKITLPIGLLTMLAIFFVLNTWFWVAYTVVVVGLCVFALVYCNTGNRFKK